MKQLALVLLPVVLLLFYLFPILGWVLLGLIVWGQILTIHKDIPERVYDYDNRLTIFMNQKTNYLFSPLWIDKRKQVLQRDKYKCRLCGTSEQLTVHHQWGYDMIPHEPLECLVTLCKTCHTKLHATHGYPQKYEDYMNYFQPVHTIT